MPSCGCWSRWSSSRSRCGRGAPIAAAAAAAFSVLALLGLAAALVVAWPLLRGAPERDALAPAQPRTTSGAVDPWHAVHACRA